MKEIKVTATTTKGNKALKQHCKEFKKMNLRDRLILKAAGYKHNILSEDPYTIVLTANNRHVGNPVFMDLIKGEIVKALEENGAKKEIDFKVEVS